MERRLPVRTVSSAALACLLGVTICPAVAQQPPAEGSVEATPPTRKPLLVFRRDAPAASQTPPQYAATAGALETALPVDDDASASSAAQLVAQESPTPQPTASDNRLPAPSVESRQDASLRRSGASLEIPRQAKQMLMTSGAGLAIVVGLLLACTWLVRRGGKQATDQLPDEALAVLGKSTLFGQTACHLIRLGNKLVLVAATGDRLQPIAEVNQPEEVDRLMGLCLANRSHSSAAEFQAVLRQLAREPTQGFLGRNPSGG